jgi:hypothetical protein
LKTQPFWLASFASLLLIVDGADRLGRIRESRILAIDLDQGQQRGQALLERELVAELLLDQVADHALGLGAEQVERVRVDGRVGGALQREQPDLGPVAVRDHELVLERHRSQRLAGHARVGTLVLGRQRLPPP